MTSSLVILFISMLVITWQTQRRASDAQRILQERTPLFEQLQRQVGELRGEVARLKAAEERHAADVERILPQKGR